MARRIALILVFICFISASNAFVAKSRILYNHEAAKVMRIHGAASLQQPNRFRNNPVTSCLLAENKEDNKDSPAPSTEDGLPGGIVVYVLAFVAFWPLLALLRVSLNDSSTFIDFDIDSYMALKGMTEAPTMNDGLDEIRELPPLSPAEQLVGALFGPPSK